MAVENVILQSSPYLLIIYDLISPVGSVHQFSFVIEKSMTKQHHSLAEIATKQKLTNSTFWTACCLNSKVTERPKNDEVPRKARASTQMRVVF